MTVYECQLFTWPYIVKNNADIELLWLKVCRAVLKKLSRVPGAWNFCRVVPPGAATSLTLTLMRTVWKIVLLWIIMLLNMSLYYIVRCCTTLKEMTQDIMLHCEKLRYTSRCYVPTLISRSPKLPLVFLELYGNTGNVLYFLSIS